MLACEPGQKNYESVFSQAQRDIRKWFRRVADRGARGYFSAMRGQGDSAAKQGGQKLHLGRKLATGSVGQKRRHRNAQQTSAARSTTNRKLEFYRR